MTPSELIITSRIIAFQRVYVEITGSITAALMLSQAVYWYSKSTKDGWFFKTQEEWKDETGMTRYEQESARKALIKSGVWEERYDRLNHRQWYRPIVAKIAELVSECGKVTFGNAEQGNALPMRETDTPDCGNPSFGKGVIPQSSICKRLQEETIPQTSGESLFPETETKSTNHPDIGNIGKHMQEMSSEVSSQMEAKIETIRRAYPKKVDAEAARKAIKEALKKRSYEYLLQKATAYGFCKLGTDPRYVKSPAKWFRDGNYDDDEAEWTETPHNEYVRSQREQQEAPRVIPKMMSAEQRRAGRASANE